jgi:hypothetical protein
VCDGVAGGGLVKMLCAHESPLPSLLMDLDVSSSYKLTYSSE